MTLEWQVSSPPPIFNFDTLPTVVGGPYEYGVPGRGARHLRPHPRPRDGGAGAGVARVAERMRRAMADEGSPRRRQPHARRREAARGRARARGRRATCASASSCRRASPRRAWSSTTRPCANRRRCASTWRSRAVAGEGDRGDRRSRRRRPVPGDDGRGRRAPARRDHRLHAPRRSSGWLRRDLVERIRQRLGAAGRARRRRPRAGGPALQGHARARQQDARRRGADRAPAGEGGRAASARLFIVVVPQPDGSGGAPREARARLATMLDRLHSAGLLGSGMIGDPDPYTAAINALELFRVDDVVISTLPGRALGLDALEPDRARAQRDLGARRARRRRPQPTPTAAPAA